MDHVTFMGPITYVKPFRFRLSPLHYHMGPIHSCEATR